MEELKNVTHVENVRLSENGHSIVILDQSALPNRTEYLTLSTLKEFYDAYIALSPDKRKNVLETMKMMK